MACSQTLGGIAADCSANVGGVKNVWLAPYSAGTASSASTQSGEMVEISTGATWHKYYFRKGAASMTSTLNVDVANGVNYIATELTMNFAKMETAKRVEVQALVLGDVLAVVEDANGKMWFLGKDEPVTATASTGVTGQAKGDANQYTITLTDEAGQYPFELEPTSAAAFRGLE